MTNNDISMISQIFMYEFESSNSVFKSEIIKLSKN